MKALKTYFNKRKSAINLILEKSPKSYIPETFHSLRVEIKKMNALFDLLNYCSKKFKRKKSPQRRARIRRNRGVTKKRTLSDSLKREFKNLRKYGENAQALSNKKEKIYLSFIMIL